MSDYVIPILEDSSFKELIKGNDQSLPEVD